MIHHDIDMRNVPWLRAVLDAFDTLLSSDKDVMRGRRAGADGRRLLEIVLDEAPLRQAMLRFTFNIMLLSLAISASPRLLVYLALHSLLVRPMRRITANMMRFRDDPENPARSSRCPSARTRSAWPSASSPACSATWPRCCSRRTISRRSASRCRRSITTCAIC
jgi:hypothetical protein